MKKWLLILALSNSVVSCIYTPIVTIYPIDSMPYARYISAFNAYTHYGINRNINITKRIYITMIVIRPY
ncbi:MAG TPA: hypothetical protein VLG50_00835 [Candidatus Saccharimonadales bacterium]|nr:hypothetical protein [Candidatus Saccharimonadales bacterium]